MMQRLIIALRHHFLHPLQILPAGLYQSLEILARLTGDGSSPTAEMRRKALPESQEAPSQLFERSWGIDLLLPFTSLRAGV